MMEIGATLWDAIIIGAGPAGSTLALSLARQRLRVLLVDQAQFPRAKVCGGCLNGSTLAALNHLGLAKLPGQIGGQPIRDLHLRTRGHAATIALDGGISVSRQAFDAALVDCCLRAGVCFRPGVRAAMENIDGNARPVTLRTATETQVAKGRVVILAHGLKAGVVDPRSRIGAGVMLDESPNDYPAEAISMAIGEGGYVGGVHVEGGRFDLAAAFDAPFVKAKGSLGRAAAAVLRQAGFPAIPGLEAAAWKGTPLLTRRPRSIAGERWFAVGDAAGYVEPFTGEGIAWAMNGAIALAPVAAKAIQEWDHAHARSWARIHARQIGRRQCFCRMLAKVLRSPGLASWLVQGLAHAPLLAGPFIHNLSRPVVQIPGAAS